MLEVLWVGVAAENFRQKPGLSHAEGCPCVRSDPAKTGLMSEASRPGGRSMAAMTSLKSFQLGISGPSSSTVTWWLSSHHGEWHGLGLGVLMC